MIVTLGVLIAVNIVLSRFLSIALWNVKIGFAFVPVVVGALLYGPVGGAVVAGLGDLVGAIAFPIGAYFPGYTVTAVITGAIYGFFLHRSRKLPCVATAILTKQVICSLGLNTLWISLMSGSPYWALLPARLFQAVVIFTAEIIVIPILIRYVPQMFPGRSVGA